MKEQKQQIGIIGTGDFARALAKRLYISGYGVIIGSRRPRENRSRSMRDECFCKFSLVSVEECIQSVSILFLAIHVDHYGHLLEKHADAFQGKIVVDVSNSENKSNGHSNAEYLQDLIPHATVVKAFNVISAYVMENEYSLSSRQVFVASDDKEARQQISEIAREMNFTPTDLGNLPAARKIERYPLRLFPEWRGPLGFAIAAFNLWMLYLIYIYYVEKTVYKWEQIFVKVLNKGICMTGITVLSVTYLASSFAALFQLYYGTKHIRFSRWLDTWLKQRKQLGLVAFILIVIHVIMSLLIMSPTYLRSWYHSTKVTIPLNKSEIFEWQNINWMNWKGEAACMTGILSFIVLCFIWVTTFPSVTDKLNWREWRFVQSKLGHFALFLAVVHVLVMGIPGWAKTPSSIYKSITFLSSILPWITLLLKLFFTIPCVDSYLTKIRKGWERNKNDCKAACAQPKRIGYVIAKCHDIEDGIANECCNCDGNLVKLDRIDESSYMCVGE